MQLLSFKAVELLAKDNLLQKITEAFDVNLSDQFVNVLFSSDFDTELSILK